MKVLLATAITISMLTFGCASEQSHDASPDNKNETKKRPSGDTAIDVSDDGILLFKDLNFEAYVKQRVDGNNDGLVDVKEAEKLTRIDLSSGKFFVTSLEGIEVFKNLSYVNCAGNVLDSMPNFLALENLNTLLCEGNFFTDADCNQLKPLMDKAKTNDGFRLQVSKQKDGRVLTCDQIEMVANIPASPATDVVASRGETVHGLSDVWGFTKDGKDYVVWSDTADVHIAEITNEAPYAKKVVTIPRGDEDSKTFGHPNHSIWSEQRYFEKDGKSYLYVSSEGNWNCPEELGCNGAARDRKTWVPRLQIIDITDLSNPVEIKVRDLHEGLFSIHNISIDTEREMLIALGGNDERIVFDPSLPRDQRDAAWDGARFYSLANPEKPEYIGTVGDLYTHDAQIKKRADGSYWLYQAHGSLKIHWDANSTNHEDNRMAIYDVTDVTNPKTLLSMVYPSGYAHNIWGTDNDDYFIATGETSMDNQLSLWKLTTGRDGRLRARFVDGLSLKGGAMAHNAFAVGNNIYVSHYTKGTQIVRVNPEKDELELTWAYDSHPNDNSADYAGVWGVFPFSNNPYLFAATDRANGLFVFKKSEEFLRKEIE